MNPEEIDTDVSNFNAIQALSELRQLLMTDEQLSEVLGIHPDDTTNEPVIDFEDLSEQLSPKLAPNGGAVVEAIEGRKALTIQTGTSTMDKRTQQMLRMSQVLGKFASTLALKPITCEMVQAQTSRQDVAPAWSDAETIYINKKRVGNFDEPETMLQLKGLGLHESAHIMMTPRNNTKWLKGVAEKNLWRSANTLEDQRIEMAMVAQFSNVDEWLSAVVAKHCINIQPEMLAYQYPLTHGRKYLDPNIRQALKLMYEKQEDVQRIGELIDEYIVLNLGDSKTHDRALEIIEEFDALINVGLSTPGRTEEQLDLDENGNRQMVYDDAGRAIAYQMKQVPINDGWDKVKDINGHEKQERGEYKSTSNKAMDKKQQESVAKNIAKALEQDKDNEPDPELMGENPFGEGDGDKDGEGKGQGDGESGDAGEHFDPSETSGKIAGKNGRGFVHDWAQNKIAEVMTANAKSIQTMTAQINGELELDGKTVRPPTKAMSYDNTPSPQAIQAVKSFARELEELKALYDPAWNRKVDQGKFNVQRYVTGAELDECFDEWDPGREDAVDIECVIALDTSGSMYYQMNSAFQYMWAIKRAMDKVNASTTVVTFSSRTELLYEGTERAGNTFKSSGMGNSTDPLKSLEYSRSVLANSKRAIKILIPITDGWWDNTKACNDVIHQLRKGGVITALAMIDDNDSAGKVDAHGCEVAVHVTKCESLYQLARAMVKVGIERNLNN